MARRSVLFGVNSTSTTPIVRGTMTSGFVVTLRTMSGNPLAAYRSRTLTRVMRASDGITDIVASRADVGVITSRHDGIVDGLSGVAGAIGTTFLLTNTRMGINNGCPT